MAAKKAPTKVRPKTPARIRKKRAKRGRGRAHPELVGLGLFALGLFLAAVLLLGWDGGVVGEKVDAGLDRLVGAAHVGAPAVAARAAGAKAGEVRRTVRDRPFAAPEDEIEAPPPAAPP